jgi:hypothetical protein
MLNLLFDKFGHITTIFDKMIMLSSLNICKHILQFFFLIFLTVPGNSVGHLPYYPSCNCAKDSSGFVCSSEDSYIRPPEFQVVTHDYMQNITGSNTEDFLLYTQDVVYRLHRYNMSSNAQHFYV